MEACIQTGLQNLIDVDFRGVKPDPVTCTRFEQKAIEKVDDCYRYPEGRSSYDLPELCTLLGNSISEQLHKDLSRLVKDFSVEGDYHVSMVDLGIPEVVRECGHPEVADSLYIGEPRLRVIFCTWGYDKRHPNVRSLDRDSYVTFLSRHFNDSESRFQYGGSGLSRLCAEKAPDSASYNIDSIYDIHVVTWFALPNNTVAKDWNVTKVTHNGADGDIFVRAFFEFTYDRTEYLANRIRDYRKCGNGRRDPGEMCDYAMLNSSACSLECEIEQPTEESEGVYECTTDRLSPSYCWLQRCGDGRKASTEECDDNNLNNGDGCSSQCRIERPQFKCSQTYNETSYCEPRSPVIGTQRQMTRNIVHAKLTDSAPPRTTVDVPLDSSGLSFARRLVSRTGLVLLMVLATLWTILTLA